MDVNVNGVRIEPERIGSEAARFAQAPDPAAAARRALAVRELLLQRAGELGLLEAGQNRDGVHFADAAAEDEVIARVLEHPQFAGLSLTSR